MVGKYVAAVDSGKFGQIALTTVESGKAKYPLSCITLAGHNLPDKSCVADTAMQIELA